MPDPRPQASGFATIVSKLSVSNQLDRASTNRVSVGPADGRPTPRRPPQERHDFLEKLEEATEFTATHDKAEHGPHRNVIQIKAFAS